MTIKLGAYTVAVALLVAGCANSASLPAQSTSEAATAPRFDHSPDLALLLKRFLSPQGFLDPEFPETVARPSKYLTDFYGIQAIKDVSRDAILGDFVPRFAEKVSEDANSVTLRFRDGYEARFFPNSNLLAAGQTLKVSHVEISGADWRTLGKNLDAFRTLVERAMLADRYLIPNKFYPEEVATYKQMTSGRLATVTVDPAGAAFAATRDGILLIPEGVHGRPEDVQIAMKTVGALPVDWIGMEMIGVEHQPTLDAYNAAKEGTPAYDAARAKLVAYFAESWNGRAGPKTTGEENLYFKLVETAHARGIKIVALEGSTIEYLLLRYGETAFGGSVRSLGWADRLPKSGRGIIFGGSAHFNMTKPINVQDFIVAKTPARRIFSLKDIKPKTGA